ncbi:MAG: LAGLIDADG family homing endonuclease [Candidatus Omnitrophota bacterium]
MLNPWYVTGFCDGEAAFTYSRSGGTFAVYFGLKQREDNFQIIEDIRQYFGYVGTIYRHKESFESPKAGHTRAATYYRVARAEELRNIIDHFDKYPLQSMKKQEAYTVWKEMAMHKIEHYRDIEYDKLHALAQKLSSLNLQSRAFKVHKT